MSSHPTHLSEHVSVSSRPEASGARLGLPQATALIVGTIIGVGIFNLPGSLASYGPISLVAMGLTTVGALALAVMFAAMSKRMPADGMLATSSPNFRPTGAWLPIRRSI